MADAAGSDKFFQRRRWRAFRDPAVEASFRAWHSHEILPVARGIGLVSVAIWASIPLGYRLTMGASPTVLLISAWAISVPLLIAILVGSYTPLVRWANELMALAVLVIGLNFIWVMSTM